jgi:hypothetical protein|uniref:Uncharacterized protein n=1 Tax=viral metagenome TaxID=1070528 RepID=A0A6C0CE66_9ZZZZ
MNILTSVPERKERSELAYTKNSEQLKQDKPQNYEANSYISILDSYSIYLPRLAFLFLLFTVVTSGFITELLSCQMRYVLTYNIYARHFLAILMIFIFIMGLGGWSIDAKLDAMAKNDWTSGNVIETLIMSLVIYSAFLISSKSQLVPNLIFFGLLLLLYLINTQRNFWKARNMISVHNNAFMLYTTYILGASSIVTLLYGFINYIYYQKSQYGDNFSWFYFILGGQKCASLENEGYGGKKTRHKKH